MNRSLEDIRIIRVCLSHRVEFNRNRTNIEHGNRSVNYHIKDYIITSVGVHARIFFFHFGDDKMRNEGHAVSPGKY